MGDFPHAFAETIPHAQKQAIHLKIIRALSCRTNRRGNTIFARGQGAALFAAVNGIEAFTVEVEINSGWGDTIFAIVGYITPEFAVSFPLIRDFLRLLAAAPYKKLCVNQF